MWRGIKNISCGYLLKAPQQDKFSRKKKKKKKKKNKNEKNVFSGRNRSGLGHRKTDEKLQCEDLYMDFQDPQSLNIVFMNSEGPN